MNIEKVLKNELSAEDRKVLADLEMLPQMGSADQRATLDAVRALVARLADERATWQHEAYRHAGGGYELPPR